MKTQYIQWKNPHVHGSPFDKQRVLIRDGSGKDGKVVQCYWSEKDQNFFTTLACDEYGSHNLFRNLVPLWLYTEWGVLAEYRE